MAGSQIESSLDGWPISKVASFLGVSKGSLYVWSCHDKWGGCSYVFVNSLGS